MEIIKKTIILVKTRRRLTLVNQQNCEAIKCEQCDEKMLPAIAAANLFGVSSRVIFRLIEQERIHFLETKEIYVCHSSVKEAMSEFL